ncbi:MAG TPA: hypothetical protein EYN66_19655 [Myxococcales bacterium]|nr:hypothetical protein [Myxococcales bacterium]
MQKVVEMTYTIRQKVPSQESVRCSVDNGNLNLNYRIKRVIAFPTTTSGLVFACLSTDSVSPGILGMDVTNNRQFGWIVYDPDGSDVNYLDPDHVIVQDFWIHNLANTVDLNFVIEMDTWKTSDGEAALYMLKERAQGPLE